MTRNEIEKNIEYLASDLVHELLTGWRNGNMCQMKSVILDIRIIMDAIQRQIKDDLYNNLRSTK